MIVYLLTRTSFLKSRHGRNQPQQSDELSYSVAFSSFLERRWKSTSVEILIVDTYEVFLKCVHKSTSHEDEENFTYRVSGEWWHILEI